MVWGVIDRWYDLSTPCCSSIKELLNDLLVLKSDIPNTSYGQSKLALKTGLILLN